MQIDMTIKTLIFILLFQMTESPLINLIGEDISIITNPEFYTIGTTDEKHYKSKF